MKDFFISFSKLLVMVVLALIVVIASFGAGIYFARKTEMTVVRVPAASAASATPSSVTGTDGKPSMDVFWEAWDIVQSSFYREVPSEQERIYGAIRGMVTTFGDEHTAFIDPSRASILQEDSSGSFEGIGASVRMDELGRLVIADPFPGRPAAEAGVQRGDVVLEVDGQSLRGYSLYEAVSLIRGPEGSTVVLTILREGEPDLLKISVVRAKIEIEVVTSKMLDGNVGYISLSEFSSGASGKVNAAIEDLRQQGATSLIFDLRSNPGGFLSESIAVSSLFLEDGVPVVRERRKGVAEDEIFRAQGLHSATDIPLVLLVNRGSASASEIVAGAMRDNGRATIIGEQTFGKGTVQLPHTLSDGSELRVTIAEWLTPDGNSIDKAGVVPDVVVELTQEDFLNGVDPQLDRAVEFLQNGK